MLGIFDSGSGGLSVLSQIKSRLPQVDVVYFGDIKNAPYGKKSSEELKELTNGAIKILLANGATELISACNSVSASVLALPKSKIVEMVTPTVESLRGVRGKILVVATTATVESGIYQYGFNSVGINVDMMAIPDLAGAIEFGASREEIRTIIEGSLKSELGKYNYLVLGCTHFPLVLDLFKKVRDKFNKSLKIFDPAVAVANTVVIRIKNIGSGKIRFLISKESSNFVTRVSEMFPSGDIALEVI